MFSVKRFAAVLALLLVVSPGASRCAHAQDLLVFAAASLQESLTEAADAYAARAGKKPVLSFGASSALARQIENGAPANLFLSADEQWMDYLAGKGLVVSGTRTSFLGNQLVLIAPAARPFTTAIRYGFPLSDILGNEKLAMADPDSVPAGRYGKAALVHLGIWTKVEANVARSNDVRAALALVERDEARAGIVYRTDALASRNVVVAGTFPEIRDQPIVYPLCIVADHDTAEARALREFLLSPVGKAIFEKHGFSVR